MVATVSVPVIPDSYFDRFHTPKYSNRNPVQRALIRRFVARLHELFYRAGPVRSVLEIGVGEGFLSGYLSETLAEVDFTGVDLDRDDLERLRAKFGRIETHQGSAYDLRFLSGPFDIVICAEILEHLDTPERALDEVLRLEPGHVLLTVPHEPWFRLSNLLRGKNVSRLGNDIEHVNHWGPRSFRKLLAPRFRIVAMTTSFPWLLTLLAPK